MTKNLIAMPKTNLADIVKNPDHFELKDIDFSDPKIRRRFEGVQKEIKASRKRKEVNWAELEKFVINI